MPRIFLNFTYLISDKTESSQELSSWTKHSPDANEQSKRLTQRMRDLYDFKTENEWPKRAMNARRGNTWISKSSSEEERAGLTIRRNSQDLEFNDRMNVIKVIQYKLPLFPFTISLYLKICVTQLKDTRDHQSDHRQRVKPTSKKEEDLGDGTDTFNSEYEERLRKFNDKLRFSEDLGTAKPKIKERRTYSDDYDEISRRDSTRSTRTEGSIKSTRTEDSARLTRTVSSVRSTRTTRTEESGFQGERKRPSDASGKSRGSYAEVAPLTPTKRDSRASDASYASIANYSGKRASVDCKSNRKMVELPPRRAFSQTEERPSTPVPPVEWNDDRYAAARLKQISERQKRDSTRYKVYLT